MTKKRSEAEQREYHDMWRQSGLTQREFCRQNNIGNASLCRWDKKFSKLASSEKTDTKDIKFYAVSKAATQENILEIVLPQGISCKVNLPVASIYNLILELCR